MTIADKILDLVDRKQHLYGLLTEQDIAEFLYGQNNAYQQLVNAACRKLVDEGRLVRDNGGGPNDPYTYTLRPLARRKLRIVISQ